MAKRKPLMTALELFRLFHQLNQDSATTGGVVAPLTPKDYDEQFYGEQIWNHYDACGQRVSEKTAGRMAKELGDLIRSGKVFVVSKSWMVVKQEITIAGSAKEAEDTIDWSKVEEDWDAWGLEVYEGSEIEAGADPVHQVDY